MHALKSHLVMLLQEEVLNLRDSPLACHICISNDQTVFFFSICINENLPREPISRGIRFHLCSFEAHAIS